jgi:hypothetical protein
MTTAEERNRATVKIWQREIKSHVYDYKSKWR